MTNQNNPSEKQKEEFLENNPIASESRGIWSSKSADVSANNGSRGKLNEEQLDERAILHAKKKVTGIPTPKEIVAHWQDKYDITMTVQCENEWARNNQERIDSAISKLEDDGDMPLVVVPPSAISSMLGKAGRDIVEIIRSNKKSQNKLNSSLEEFIDPYKQIGAANKEAYWKSEGETRKVFDKRLEFALKVNRAVTDNYRTISNATVEQGKLLVSVMDMVHKVNASQQTLDRTIEKKMSDKIKELGIQQQERKDRDSANPLDPISDDDRIN